MTMAEPHIRASLLAGLDSFLQEDFGIKLPDLLIRLNLEPDIQARPDELISLNLYSRLLELAAAESKDDCLGLHFAKRYPRGGTGALGFLMLNAPDLRTSLSCLCRYVRLQCDGVDFGLEESRGIATLRLECRPTFVAPRKQFIEFVLALIVDRVGATFGDGWEPLKVEFEYSEPRCREEYATIFGRQLAFEQVQSAITFRSELLRSPGVSENHALFGFLEQIAEKELAQIQRIRDIVWHVDGYIVETLGLRSVTLEGAARAVDRTPRQLQSDLKRQGTTFEAQLSLTRKALAERYLRDTNLSVTEIALMLGFSELSAFTRAAQRWFGMAPSQFRQQMRK